MKAVILAAGIASRLRPLTDTTPKCLLKVGERCLLQRAFDALLQNGFREFVIVTGYRQQQIVDFLESHYPALRLPLSIMKPMLLPTISTPYGSHGPMRIKKKSCCWTAIYSLIHSSLPSCLDMPKRMRWL